MEKLVATSLATLMFAGTLINPTVADAEAGTTTPIKHLVVIFQENVSFDHYFGTYPKAMNLAGETSFVAKKDTPTVNNLVTPLDVNNHFTPLSGLDLIHDNPNGNPTAPNNGKQ